MSGFHTPVMVQESVRFLALRAGGTYVDATTGGGGHSLAMLKAEAGIRLFCFDQDEEALEEAGKTLTGFDQAEFIRANFASMRTELALRQIKGIDGILFDLGVSSHQLDKAERGFSIDKQATLDMRMDQVAPRSAWHAVNELPESELAKIFREYGEELSAKRIARAISKAEKPIEATQDLVRIIETVVGSGSKESLKTKIRIFQALRIYVNDELEVLTRALTDAINLLNPGGRIVVLSYHSLEDRIVKQSFRKAEQDCLCPPAIINCVCDHYKQLKVLTRSPLEAGEEEVKVNPRARSAKLRAAEKTASPKMKYKRL